MKIILTTVASDDASLDERIRCWIAEGAGCIQVDRVHSWYRWNGELQSDDERRLVIKVADPKFEGLLQKIRDTHPYDEPQLIWFDAEATPGYEGFLRQ